tara:strand:- start:737 stop:1228 length:492 start_codon:yes stop_codon:yes gene_type:complete
MFQFLSFFFLLISLSLDLPSNNSLAVASIENSELNLLLSKAEILEHFKSISAKQYHNVELVEIEEYSEPYYFLKLSSIKHRAYLMRWLVLEDDTLKIKDISGENWDHLNNYVECEGDEDCFPRLLLDPAGIPRLACTDNLECVSPDSAKEHPCKHATMRVFNN